MPQQTLARLHKLSARADYEQLVVARRESVPTPGREVSIGKAGQNEPIGIRITPVGDRVDLAHRCGLRVHETVRNRTAARLVGVLPRGQHRRRHDFGVCASGAGHQRGCDRQDRGNIRSEPYHEGRYLTGAQRLRFVTGT